MIGKHSARHLVSSPSGSWIICLTQYLEPPTLLPRGGRPRGRMRGELLRGGLRGGREAADAVRHLSSAAALRLSQSPPSLRFWSQRGWVSKAGVILLFLQTPLPAATVLPSVLGTAGGSARGDSQRVARGFPGPGSCPALAQRGPRQ